MRIDAPPREHGAYAEACGRLGALEKRLLGTAALEECLAVPDAAAAAEVLARRGTLAPAGTDLPGRWEEALERAAAADDRELLRLDPRPAVSRVLLARHDLANLRGLLRARALGREYDGPWHPRATLPHEALALAAGGRGDAGLPPRTAAAARRLADAGPAASLQEIDDRLDAAWLLDLRHEVRAAGSAFFLDWLGHLADLANLRARLRYLAAPDAWPAEPGPLPGGHLDPRHLEVAGGFDALRRRLDRTVYGPLLARAASGDGGLSLAGLDREADDLLTGLLRPARRLALGPERLWAWHLAHDVDAKNVRALMLGKLAGAAPDDIRRRLRLAHAA